MSDNFCLSPFATIALGKIALRPCCLWKITDYEERHKWELVEDIEKMWYSEWMQDARKSFLEGKLPANCNPCFRRIQPRNIWYEKRIGKYFKKERMVLKPPFKPLHMDYHLGNICNTQCMICGSWACANWEKADITLKEMDLRFERSPKEKYSLDAGMFKDQKEMFSDVVRFDFKGGEPMINSNAVEMAENFIRWDRAKDLVLTYITNGSTIDKESVKLWKYFKQVMVMISMDGIGDMFSYIRGYDFAKFEKNLYRYDNIEHLKHVYYNVTMSIYNLFDAPEIAHWIMTRPFNIIPCLQSGVKYHFTSNVTRPKYLDPRILPRKYKQLAFDKASECEYYNILPFTKWLESVKDIPRDEEQLRLFVRFTRTMDKMRGVDFLSLRPQFEDIFKEYS